MGFGMPEMAGVWGSCCFWVFFLVAGITKLKWILLEDVEVPELGGLVGLVPSVALPAENTFALWMFLNIVDLLSDIFCMWKILIPLLKFSVPQFFCSLSAELEFPADSCKAPVTAPCACMCKAQVIHSAYPRQPCAGKHWQLQSTEFLGGRNLCE